MDDRACPVCGGAAAPEPRFQALPQVTSDCKPWPAGAEIASCTRCGTIFKPATQAWRDATQEIYEGYEIYALAEGAEQPIFDLTGAAAPRSKRLVEFLKEKIDFPASGKLIDIGCGNGGALSNYSQALPGWQHFGCELADTALPLLKRIPNFAQLYVGPFEEVDATFDFISLIHSLEHMPSPVEALKSVLQMLNTGAHALIEVPDVATSPFDILVADHRVHFSTKTLELAALSAGCGVTFISNDVLVKEITMILAGTAEAGERPSANPEEGRRMLAENVAWLERILNSADASARKTPDFGVFGTAISGMWLFGAMPENVKFFVDEDPGKIGKEIEGRPILAPEDVNPEHAVFVPTVPIAARQICARLNAGGNFIAPPGA